MEYRRRAVDRLSLELAGAQARLHIVETHLADLRAAEAATLRHMHSQLSSQRDAVMDVAEAIRHQQHLDLLEGQIAAASTLVDRAQGEVDRCQARVVAANREVKALELLRDRQHDEHALTERRREQSDTDETAMLQHRRLQADAGVAGG